MKKDKDKIEYKHTERIGLYIMVIIIFLIGPCSKITDHQEIINRLDRIETSLKIDRIETSLKTHYYTGN